MKRSRSTLPKGGYTKQQVQAYKKRRVQEARDKWGNTYAARKQALGEIKMVDVANITLKPGLTGGPGTLLMNGLQDGSAYWNRIGRKINMTSYSIEGSFIPNVAATEGDRATFHIRYIVIYDRQPNGTAPNYSDIFTSRTDDGSAIATIYSQVNEANKDRFLILENKLFMVPSGNITNDPAAGLKYDSFSWGCRDLCVGDWSPVNIKTYRKLPALPTSYSASTGDIGDIRTGSLYMMLIHNSTTGGECPLQFIGSIRMRFADVN